MHEVKPIRPISARRKQHEESAHTAFDKTATPLEIAEYLELHSSKHGDKWNRATVVAGIAGLTGTFLYVVRGASEFTWRLITDGFIPGRDTLGEVVAITALVGGLSTIACAIWRQQWRTMNKQDRHDVSAITSQLRAAQSKPPSATPSPRQHDHPSPPDPTSSETITTSAEAPVADRLFPRIISPNSVGPRLDRAIHNARDVCAGHPTLPRGAEWFAATRWLRHAGIPETDAIRLDPIVSEHLHDLCELANSVSAAADLGDNKLAFSRWLQFEQYNRHALLHHTETLAAQRADPS